jgi:hypothetical protein
MVIFIAQINVGKMVIRYLLLVISAGGKIFVHFCQEKEEPANSKCLKCLKCLKLWYSVYSKKRWSEATH